MKYHSNTSLNISSQALNGLECESRVNILTEITRIEHYKCLSRSQQKGQKTFLSLSQHSFLLAKSTFNLSKR